MLKLVYYSLFLDDGTYSKMFLQPYLVFNSLTNAKAVNLPWPFFPKLPFPTLNPSKLSFFCVRSFFFVAKSGFLKVCVNFVTMNNCGWMNYRSIQKHRSFSN